MALFQAFNISASGMTAERFRTDIIAENIANVNTPGYKRKDLNFENTLKTELGRCKHESLDSKMKDVDLSRLNPSVYVDSSNYSYRLDGSNVDIDTEEVELASEQIRYQGITAGINGQFDRMRSVIK